MDNLQALIDQTPLGETLKLIPGEYQGPATVNKQMVLEGSVQDGKIRTTIWGAAGPIISITSDDVHLQNLNVEVTMANSNSDDDCDVAIKSETGLQVGLDNVTVRGRLVGLDGESGEWLMPRSLNLDVMAARKMNSFKIKLYVPVPCQMSSKISGLTVKPMSLRHGLNEVSIEVRDLCKDCFISGAILVRSAFVYRSIEISGRTPSNGDVEPVVDSLLWEPQVVPVSDSEPVKLPQPIVEEPPLAISLPSQRPDDASGESSIDFGQSRDTGDDTNPEPYTNPSVPVVTDLPEPEQNANTVQNPPPIKPKTSSKYRRTDGGISPVFSTPVAEPDAVDRSDENSQTIPDADSKGDESFQPPKTRSLPNPDLFGSRNDDVDKEIAQEKNMTDPVSLSKPQNKPTVNRRVNASGLSPLFQGIDKSEDTSQQHSSSGNCPSDKADDVMDKSDPPESTEKKAVEPKKVPRKDRTSTGLGGAFG